MQDDGEFSAHHDGMSYRSLLPPIPHLINEGRTTCVYSKSPDGRIFCVTILTFSTSGLIVPWTY